MFSTCTSSLPTTATMDTPASGGWRTFKLGIAIMRSEYDRLSTICGFLIMLFLDVLYFLYAGAIKGTVVLIGSIVLFVLFFVVLDAFG